MAGKPGGVVKGPCVGGFAVMGQIKFMGMQMNIIEVREVIGSTGNICRTIQLFLPDSEIQHSEESTSQAIRGVSHRMITEKENGLPAAFMGIEGRPLRCCSSLWKRGSWESF